MVSATGTDNAMTFRTEVIRDPAILGGEPTVSGTRKGL
jgi:uncharacterized protein (DUF433 family)